MLLLALAPAQATTVTLTSGTSWTVPANVTSVTVQVWGGGGAGGGNTTTQDGGGGGGGGGYSTSTITVSGSVAYSVGAGGTGLTGTGTAGGTTTFGSVSATGGTGGQSASAGRGGGSGGSGTYSGGSGGDGHHDSNGTGGGGGSSAGIAADGRTGGNGGNYPGAGGNAPTGGGDGGDGGDNGGHDGSAGSVPGGGGGGSGDRSGNGSSTKGGNGARGQIIITYKVNQSITFGAAPTVVVGGTGTVSATGGASGNAVTFTSLTTSVCTVSGTNGSTITGVAVGTCTIAANQAGNTADYNAAPQVTQNITVGQGTQTITFGAAPTVVVGGTGTVSATGGASGNPVIFTSTTTGVCTVSGTNGATVTGVTVGTCIIAANQAGNGNYNPATQVQQNFTVNNPAPTTTSISPTSANVGATGFTMTVNGTNFVSTSQVQLGGAARTTTYVSPTVLTVAILTADMTTAATYNVTVVNPTPGGGTSNAQSFTIIDPLCFTDDFNRASLLATSNWTRTTSGTAFDADIVNNRLRLTDANTGRATAVHLGRLFPGFGNKVVAEFNYFAYGGTGADGMAITLSDASISPAAGAYGGSLGYAQKIGIDGFAGGWIGIGLDEFGNYSNPTEGRVDGACVPPVTCALPNEVAIRGSGSGQSKYNYHTRALAAPIGNSAGDRYRITVDHSDSVHANVSVDRDNTTRDGTNYVNIIPVYDAKAISTQAAVPTNWFFSFTSSTGDLTNIHEIDNLKVCSARPQVIPVLDHVRIIHDGSALTCAPETITLRACANATCSALYTGGVTVNLSAISGATWSSNPVTFSGGEVQVTLTKTTNGTVTLGGNVAAPVSMAAVCYNGSTSGDCSLTFSSSACAFDAVEPTQSPGTPIFMKLAGVPFNLDVLALTNGNINTGFAYQVTVALVDQTGVADGACGSTVLASPTAPTSPYTFTTGNAGRRTFTFTYPNAARDVRVRIVRVSSGLTGCSSDNFVIRPTSFSVSSPPPASPATTPLAATNTTPSGTPTFKAGTDVFALNATSLTNYTGTALINNYRVAAHSGAVQAGAVSGTFSPATSGTSGVSKGTAFTYSEVGNFSFQPWGVYDDGSFASVDKGKPTPECFIDNKIGTNVDPSDPNAKNGNGMYGCYFGGTANSPYFGRFIPDHFDTTVAAVAGVPMACPAGLTCPTAYNGMVYSGQPFSVQVAAKNAVGNVTQNYQGSFAKGVTLSAAAASGGAALATASPGGTLSANTLAATAFAVGLNSVTPANPVFTFATALTAPTDVYVRAIETAGGDGVSSLRLTNPTTTSVEGGVKVVPGRIRLSNAFGTRTSPLAIPVQAQFWSGNSWVISATDASSLTAAAVALAPTTTVNGLSWSGGQGFINLAPPAAPGSIDVSLNLGVTGSALASCVLASGGAAANSPWLRSRNGSCSPNYDRDPSARATFGIYSPETKKTVHVRELY